MSERGMSSLNIGDLMDRATVSLGGSPEFALVLLNEASAYPHGSLQVQAVREGSTITIGLRLHGARLSVRHFAHLGVRPGERAPAQGLGHRQTGQEIALETAKVGLPVGRIDDAVRRYYESEGWGPGYKLPGTLASHRPRHRP